MFGCPLLKIASNVCTYFSETPIDFSHGVWRHIAEDSNVSCHRQEILKPHQPHKPQITNISDPQ
jgi:hypothetical protein